MEEYRLSLEVIGEIVAHLEEHGTANYQGLHITFNSNSDRYAGLGNILQGMVLSRILEWCEDEKINLRLRLKG